MAGAAVMGMAGEMLVAPFGALIAGFLAGLIPPLGFRFLTVSRLGTAEDAGPRAGGPLIFGGGCIANPKLPNLQ